jgi:hypothetical protein
VPSYTVIPQQALEKTQSQAILKYIRSVSVRNKRTANEYLGRLSAVETFIRDDYSFSVDELTIQKRFSVDIYDLLSNYVDWLSRRINKDGSKLLSSVSIKNRIINVMNEFIQEKIQGELYSSNEYHIADYILYRSTVTKLLEDKFAAEPPKHTKKGNMVVFNLDKLRKIQ